jgi:flavodoxin
VKIVVLFQSMRGTTRKVAGMIGEALADRGHDVHTYPVTAFDYQKLAEADLVIVGTWTDGLILFGQRPGQMGKLNIMPDIPGKRVGVFVTYEFAPKAALPGLAEWAESKGAVVVARAGFNKRKPEEALGAFLDDVLAGVAAAV